MKRSLTKIACFFFGGGGYRRISLTNGRFRVARRARHKLTAATDISLREFLEEIESFHGRSCSC